MAKQVININAPSELINVGRTANDRSGDPLRSAFTKMNDAVNKIDSNFTELYTLTGGTAADLKELAQDYAAEMFTGGTHSGITVAYNDSTNKINLTVPAGFSGSYNDLTETPAIPADVSDLTDITNLLSGGAANTGDVTFDGVKIIGAGAASGDGSGNSTLELVPDSSFYENEQYLIIDPTAPNHIHIRAGGTQDASTAELFLGGEINNVRIADSVGLVNIQAQSTISLNANNSATRLEVEADQIYLEVGQSGSSKTWQFQDTGGLTFPDSTVQTTAFTGGTNLTTVAKTGTVDSEGATALDLTKAVQKLTNGYYSLADGVEGQLMYLVPQTGVTNGGVTVIVNNARILNSSGATTAQLFAPAYYFPFTFPSDNSILNIATMIFTDGAWQSSAGTWD